MELTFLEILPIALIICCLSGLLLTLYFIHFKHATTTSDAGVRPEVRRRRAAPNRLQRVAAAAAAAEAVGNEASESAGPSSGVTRRKKKKEANREAKRAAQEARQAALAAHHEREEMAEELREEEEEREREEEARAAEEMRRIAEEKEKKEQEEYEEWKGLISVEDTGEVGDDMEEDDGMLQRFCGRLKREKIVVLEDLGGEFGLRTEEVVQRLMSLQENGTVSGFFDDRGKFVYVSREEMEEVAKFIEKRGRVSIQELGKESSRLLHLDSVVSS